VALKNYENQRNLLKKQINYLCSHSQHPDFHQHTKEKSVFEKLITGIPESSHVPLMKVAYKLLI
jgi:hypothetical protein